MGTIGIIASIIAAIVAIANFWFSFRNSKKSIIRRIEKKEKAVQKIDDQIFITCENNRKKLTAITELEQRKAKLEQDIVDLKKLL